MFLCFTGKFYLSDWEYSVISNSVQNIDIAICPSEWTVGLMWKKSFDVYQYRQMLLEILQSLPSSDEILSLIEVVTNADDDLSVVTALFCRNN